MQNRVKKIAVKISFERDVKERDTIEIVVISHTIKSAKIHAKNIAIASGFQKVRVVTAYKIDS